MPTPSVLIPSPSCRPLAQEHGKPRLFRRRQRADLARLPGRIQVKKATAPVTQLEIASLVHALERFCGQGLSTRRTTSLLCHDDALDPSLQHLVVMAQHGSRQARAQHLDPVLALALGQNPSKRRGFQLEPTKLTKLLSKGMRRFFHAAYYAQIVPTFYMYIATN